MDSVTVGRSQNGDVEEVAAIRAPNEVAIRSFVGGGMHGWAVCCVTVLRKALCAHAGGGERMQSHYRVALLFLHVSSGDERSIPVALSWNESE